MLRDVESLLHSDASKSELTHSFRDDGKTGLQLVITAEAIFQRSSLLQRQAREWCTRDVQGVCKDSDAAKVFNSVGGKYLQQEKFLEAAQAYSQALQNAPQNDAAQLGFASKLYSNRALCLLKTSQGRCSKVMRSLSTCRI